MSNDRSRLRHLFRVLVMSVSPAWMLSLAAGFALVANVSDAEETTNRLAANRLAQNRLASNRLAQNRLAQNALSSTRLEANQATADLLATEDGRSVYGYLISCALPDGMTIEAEVPGAPDIFPPDSVHTCSNEHCVFSGSLGLAEDWIDHALDPTGQRWVSACMFARVNAFVTTEAISLRGGHANLTVGEDEGELFTVEEGAFFGNLFTKDDEPIDWNACRGEGQASGEFAGLVIRDCAEEDPANPGLTLCGFNYAGDCADSTPETPSPYACRFFDDSQGIYGHCHATSGMGHWPGSPPYRQPITVYVSE